MRRGADQQQARINRRFGELIDLLGLDYEAKSGDVQVDDQVLAPGYGQLNDEVMEALDLSASREALILDPVYTGRTMAGLIAKVRSGEIKPGSTVLFVHTGGIPA